MGSKRSYVQACQLPGIVDPEFGFIIDNDVSIRFVLLSINKAQQSDIVFSLIGSGIALDY